MARSLRIAYNGALYHITSRENKKKNIFISDADRDARRKYIQRNALIKWYVCSVGHVFQGRLKGILVEKENYLLELSRYIVLNPIRANMVATASDWIWSSYRATVDEAHSPNWLSSNSILALFSSDRQNAIKKFQEYVELGLLSGSPWHKLKHQIYLGLANFVKYM